MGLERFFKVLQCCIYIFFFILIIESLYFDKWNIIIDIEGLIIYCSYGVFEGLFLVCEIKWIKNGEILDLRNKKYVEGQSNDGLRLNERYLTIFYSVLEDKGNYICIVINVEGFVLKDVILGKVFY